MHKILVNPFDAVRLLGVSAARFITLQSSKRISPEIVDGRLFYDLHVLKKAIKLATIPPQLPEEGFVTVVEALGILRVCRKTFYDRVRQGTITLHKVGKRSYIKKVELYADDDLF